MSTPSDTFAEKISNLLQQNWDSDSTGIQMTDVFWSHDKFDTMSQVEQVSQKAIVSTYNPQNPVAVEVLTPQTNFIHETIVVDVILHVAILGGTDSCIALRESVRQFILKILHAHQTLLPGANLMNVEGEYVRGELPQIQRETFKVAVSFFDVSPA
ncbi:MAG: hypothetical protein ABSG33_10660 [Candidatus Bathyarchaeia archaeon]|jgi:hypothetical protein